jgi:hypothetical protein
MQQHEHECSAKVAQQASDACMCLCSPQQAAAEKLPSVQDKAGHVISATRRDLSGGSHSLKPAYSSVF